MKTLLVLCLPFVLATGLQQHVRSESSEAANLGRPAEVTTPNIPAQPSFRRHVIPLLGRSGCNGRECHGSLSGQGGFQLSLFGYDFAQDHQEITAQTDDERRVDVSRPEASLLLLKPTMQEKHKGKERFKKGSWEYEYLLRWITAGAKNDATEAGDFHRLEVLPKEVVFENPGDTAQLRVLAHWKDGSVEDVTALTRFRTNDESVAVIDDSARVQSKGKGDTHVVAFYDNGVAPVPVMLPASDRIGPRYPQIVSRTKVDELVNAKLRKLGIVPSERNTDAEFLRRVSLDLAGTLPMAREVEAFLADRSPDKRARKIEELLASPGYAAWWATKLCDFTGNNPRGLIKGGGMTRNLSAEMSRQWYDWLYRRAAENTPYDELAAGIIVATSRTAPEQSYRDFALEMGSYFREEKPADFGARPNMPYYWTRQNVQKPEDRALAFAHTFLGVRIECAQCHKHPFDQWTKSDFEQFQMFFAGVVYGPRPRKDGSTEEMSFQSLSQELKLASGASPMIMGPEPEKMRPMEKAALPPGEPPKKGNVKMKGGNPKAEATEETRRLRMGEPLPWPEVFVDIGRAFQAKSPVKQTKADGSARVITPKLLGGEEVMLRQYNDPRQPLLDWLRDKENPYFARAFVNRVWANYFGRGIVEPADDLNLANAPSNAELLDYLSTTFVARGYDMKWLHREIVNSDTYQRSWRPNATNAHDEKNYSRALTRRLPAEVLLDAVTIATASEPRAAHLVSEIAERAIGPAGNAATYSQGKGGGAGGGAGYALATFGKPPRESNCDCERTADPTLLQTLFMRNDPDLLQRIEWAKGSSTWIDDLRGDAPRPKGAPGFEKVKMKRPPNEEPPAEKPIKRKPNAQIPDANDGTSKPVKKMAPDESILPKRDPLTRKQEPAIIEPNASIPPKPLDRDAAIREVFLRTVSRPPTADEFELARKELAAAPTPVDGIRDLLWALLNTREFMVNH